MEKVDKPKQRYVSLVELEDISYEFIKYKSEKEKRLVIDLLAKVYVKTGKGG